MSSHHQHYHRRPSNSVAPSWFIIKVTVVASLGGCLFGYDMGAISGALPQLAYTFSLTQIQQQWVVSILYLGGGLGACIGGTICDIVGRKQCILGTDVFFGLGAAWLYYFANSYESILVGRFIVGMAVAVSGIADVSYLHEMAPLEWRGAIVSVNEACISLGFLLAYMAGYFYSSAEKEEWRIIFGLAGGLALIQGIGMWNMPESPIWLAQQGRYEESRQAWNRIHSGDRPSASADEHPENEHPHIDTVPVLSPVPGIEVATTGTPVISNLHPINDDPDVASRLAHQSSEKPKPEAFHSFASLERMQDMDVLLESTSTKWWCMGSIQTILAQALEIFRSSIRTIRNYRRQTYIALFLAMTQQFCGQTNVLNYAPYIFAQAAAGQNDLSASGSTTLTTVAIGGVKFLVTVVVIWKIESVGRRTLLLFGMTCISLGMLALIVSFGGSQSGNDPDSWPTNLKTFHLALPGVLLVVCGYSMSFGPLTWLLTAELFPTEIRGRALGASTIITYLCASLVTRTFLSASSAMGPARVFGLYCIITTCGIVFAYLTIPDTGDKTTEQIEDALQRMWWWRYDSILLSQVDDGGDTQTPPPTMSATNDTCQNMTQSFELQLRHPRNGSFNDGPTTSTSHFREIL